MREDDTAMVCKTWMDPNNACSKRANELLQSSLCSDEDKMEVRTALDWCIKTQEEEPSKGLSIVTTHALVQGETLPTNRAQLAKLVDPSEVKMQKEGKQLDTSGAIERVIDEGLVTDETGQMHRRYKIELNTDFDNLKPVQETPSSLGKGDSAASEEKMIKKHKVKKREKVEDKVDDKVEDQKAKPPEFK